MIQLITPYIAAIKSCDGGSFFGFPTWYKYLPGNVDAVTKSCSPSLASVNDVWLIGAAIIEILLRVASLAAVVYLIYGGVTYVTSQGEPDKTTKAKTTIINGLVGLVVAVMASFIVSFIAGSIN